PGTDSITSRTNNAIRGKEISSNVLWGFAINESGSSPQYRLMQQRLNLQVLRLSAILVATVVAFTATVTVRAQNAPTIGPVFEDGQAQIVPEFADKDAWIREELWVETEFDSDADGKRDRVHVSVTRQPQTESAGLKVPVVYQLSPYYSGT